MTKEDLKDYLIEEAEWSEYQVNSMTPHGLLEYWLEYNGIVGFTDDIIEVIGAAYGINLEDMTD